jgi:nicotinamidase-related amidase
MEAAQPLEIDAKTTAFVTIDLQQGIVGRPMAPHGAADVIQRCATLASTLREKGGLVIYVHALANEFVHLPADAPSPRPATPFPASASELVPEAGRLPADPQIAKRQWGAFYGTNLEQQLRRRGIRTIILGGVATNIGVESTARAAFDQGYELVFAEDAMSSMSAEMHEFPFKYIFPRMGRVRSTEQIIAAIQ